MKKLSETLEVLSFVGEDGNDIEFEVYFEDDGFVFESIEPNAVDENAIGRGIKKFMNNRQNKKAAGAKKDINKELADKLKPLIAKIFKKAKQIAGKLAAAHGVPKEKVMKLLKVIKIKNPSMETKKD